jgi:formylglycine-generating enzyme required for sulfatase activity
VSDQLRSIQEYVYAKYIEGSGATPIDEMAAIDFLEEMFSEPGRESDPDCFYAGIMYFELGWEKEDKQVEYFERAKYWLDRYKALTGGEEWDAIDDRLLDLNEFFEEHGIEVESTPLPADAPVPLAPVEIQEIQDGQGAMLLIAGGSFLFGHEKSTVSLAPFYIDKFPVTNRQYEHFCRTTGYRFPKYWQDERFNNPNAPVVGVSVADAQRFSRWAGKQLPSEEQWEKACRGIDGRMRPWGDEEAREGQACFGRDPATGTTDPVEASVDSASPYGVRDLIGNVWEWTSTADVDGENVNVIKGGCYNDPAEMLTADQRLGAAPKDKFETIGFRCVRNNA